MQKTYINGFSLAYDRRGRGTPFVLLHGYPLDHTIWQPVVRLLEERADLILPDLRGFGESETPKDEYTLPEIAADLAALLDHLKIKQVALAGHSMGGYVALAFAHAYPERVLGLGLVASQSGADTPEGRKARYAVVEQVRSEGVKAVADGMAPRLTPNRELQAQLRELILQQHPEGIVGALKALAGRPDSTPYLADFAFHISVVHGLEDNLIPIERARELQASVRQGYLVELKGVGHMPMMEAPRTTAEALSTLL
jgi:pimeloyl-ACP methyl ester carboxylesterase